MISLETFTTWIKAIQSQKKADDDFHNALKKLHPDNYYITSITEEYFIAQDRLLEDIFGEENAEIIQWWLYECGPENTIRDDDDYIKPLIYDKDDNVIADLTEIEDLYDYVIEYKR